MIFFRPRLNALMRCKIGDALVTVAKVRRARADTVQICLDDEPVCINGRAVVSGSEVYRNVEIEVQQNGRDLLVILICPQPSDPADFAKVYPRGAPTLTVAPKGSGKSEVRKRVARESNDLAAWPEYC